MLEVKWLKERISKRDRISLCKNASSFRAELLEEWEAKVKYAD